MMTWAYVAHPIEQDMTVPSSGPVEGAIVECSPQPIACPILPLDPCPGDLDEFLLYHMGEREWMFVTSGALVRSYHLVSRQALALRWYLRTSIKDSRGRRVLVADRKRDGPENVVYKLQKTHKKRLFRD